MIISIASGKGGTGKTTIATNLASALEDRCQFLDCDVEEPNAHLFLKPDIKSEEKVFKLVPKADMSKCVLCGHCQEVCAFHAIAVVGKKHLVFPALCHGCGACAHLCPYQAIIEEKKQIGVVQIGEVDNIDFFCGYLNVGEAMAPPVIREVKKYIKKDCDVIIDAPPGTSCPVIEAVKGSDFSILVTEPTPFGLNDLKLGVEVLRKLGISFGVVVNRSDLGDDKTTQYCDKENIDILMSIPFDREIAQSYSKGILMVDAIPAYRQKFLKLWDIIKKRVLK